MNLTALDYLEAERKAARNASAKLAFRRLKEELKRQPEASERLAFEFLAMSWRDLDRGGDGRLVIQGICLSDSIAKENLTQYEDWVEKIASQCFRSMAQEHTLGAEFTLTAALASLRRTNSSRFDRLYETLMESCAGAGISRRCELLAEAKWSAAERRQHLAESRKKANTQQRQKEDALKSNMN